MRRLFVGLVAAVVLVLVWGVVGLVRGLGGGDGGGSATPVVAERDPSATPTGTAAADEPDRLTRAERRKAKEAAEAEKERLARPSGPCAKDDVVVTPEVVEPYVGAPGVVLHLSTVESEACTYDVSPESVVLEIRDAKGQLWSSQDCPASIPTREVVPRREKPAVVPVAWNGKQSDRDCSDATDWIYPGEYVAEAIAVGSVTPVEVGFEMTKHPPVERTVKPEDEDPSDEPTGEARDQATDEATGGTETGRRGR